MKNILQKSLILITVVWLLAEAAVSEASWRLDEDPALTEPRNFRMSSDDWRITPDGGAPARAGLENLRISGSAQPTADIFAKLYSILSDAAPGAPIYDVDLQQESHGFADGIPVSWYEEMNQANEGKTIAEAAYDETTRLSELAGNTTTFSPEGKSDTKRFDAVTFAPQNVQNEKEIVEAIGFRYVRFYVTDRKYPDTATIEAFLDFVESLPDNAWVHFHCHAGHGRTTSFMAMYDMIRNPDIPFEEIIKRQYLLGGSDLTALKNDARKNEWGAQRLELLQNFSRYIRAKHAGETALRWGEWIASQGL
ncbi:MAG: hypothetical protein K6F62_01380 [Schwartzia sp.]|nr:hypothetical protein [Schwartzia sp. (in: firmicutes)]